jgi:hypothetical protein
MTEKELAKRLNIPLHRNLFTAKLHVRWLAVVNMETYWIFKEPKGYAVMNLVAIDKINKLKALAAPSDPKLRERDLNRLSVYRFPANTWGKLKIVSR